MKNVDDIYPLSPMQQGMLFETLYAPSSGIYVEQLSCIISGDLDLAAFERAWQRVVERHPVLRTAFVWEKLEQPLQIVRQQIKLPYAYLDWRELSSAAQQQRLRLHLETDRRTGFELVRAPLLRLALIRLDKSTHQFIWSYHHLLLDGWSEGLIFREVVACYEAFRLGADFHHDLPRPYRDYIAWLQEQDLTEAQGFWRTALQGLEAPPLFLDCAMGSRTSERVADHLERQVSLGSKTTSRLLDFGRENQLTPGTVLQGAWALLLSRYSGEQDVVYGTVVSGRPPELIGVEEMVGLFINTLPVRSRVQDEESVVAWLKGLQEEQVAARAYEYSPLMRVQEWSGLGRSRPLFDTLFVFENYPLDAPLRVTSSTIKVRNFSRLFEKTNYPLTIAAVPGEQLLLQVSYDSERIDADTIERLLGHYQTLLTGMVVAAERRVADVPLLTEPERQQLLVTWNNATLSDQSALCVHELFEAQVERTPDAVAVICGDQQVSYCDLNSRANQLARYLRSRGVNSETTVGTLLERCVEQMVALLGILKAGGAYLPLDPDCPLARSTFMIRDARVKLLLTQTHLRDRLPKRAPALVYLDRDLAAIAREAITNLDGEGEADNLAYVIYTSGSTGRPKGVLVTHRSLASSLSARLAYYHQPVSSFLLLSPFAFDSSLAGIFWTICRGGALLIPEEGRYRDANHLSRLIVRKQVSHLLCVPSLYSLLLETIGPGVDCLRVVVVAGEPCLPQLVERHQELLPQVSFFNEYGPTEATVWSSVHQCSPQQQSVRVPIGRPIPNTQLYLLDAKLNLLPIGIAGDLYIGGQNLARGYLDRPALTAERFIPNPFGIEGARLYKTGDRAQYRADGEIEFLGRVDGQVKVRGHRVEPGEIETVLKAHPSVGQCAVIARTDGAGATRLIAFVAFDPGSQSSPTELSSFLQEKLPTYMIPAGFVLLDELPLGSSGKVDRALLLESDQPQLPEDRAFVAPRTSVEETLAALWAQALKIERIGVHDNFFELGGDSVLAIQIIARARQAGLRFTPPQLFQHPTIAALATLAGTPEVAQSEHDIVTGPVPLTPVQHWFFEQNSVHPHHYNQAVLLETRESLDPGLLKQAVAYLLMYHDALRMRFAHTDRGWRQTGTGMVEGDDAFSLIDLSGLPESEHDAGLEREQARLQASLDISSGPLIRVALFDLGRASGRLLFAVHHLAVDGVSFRILIEDLEAILRQLSTGALPSLPPKTLSFKRWATQLEIDAHSAWTARELDYWLALPWHKVLPLPVDKDGGVNSEASAAAVRVSLSSEETRTLLQEVLASYHTQINVVLLAALAQAFSRSCKAPILLLELEGHGREALLPDLDLTRTVGWFTTIFPVLLELPANASPGEAVRAVKEQMRRLPRRGIGYGLLRYLRSDEEITTRLRGLPRAEVSFNYLGQLDQLFPPESLFAPARESSGAAHDPRGRRRHLLEINSFVLEGQLQLSWTYSENVYRAATVEVLAAEFITALQVIIAHGQSAESQAYTPADFSLAELDEKQLAGVIEKVSRAKK